MDIPKTIRVGNKRYTIKLQHVDEPYTTGYTVDNLIVIASSNKTKHTTENERVLTFWHELTHVILDHVRPKLSNDEQFVEHFAETMHQIVKSARF
jgi:hypothetical protein